MPQLQPAGLFGRIVSSFFPKKLEVQLEANQLTDGSIELNPVYLIDGQQVDSSQINIAHNQRVLGYAVKLDEVALSVRRQGTAKLTKRKAAGYLGELKQKGVSVRTRGKKLLEVNTVKPEISLILNPDDSLDIRSELATSNGVIVEKPIDLEQLRRDEGWYVANGNLVHTEPTDTALDNMLLVGDGKHHLTGDSVPGFLERVGAFNDKIGHIERNDALQNLDVYGKDREHRAKVDGDQEAIHVSPSLTVLGKDRYGHELTLEELADLEKRRGGYKRIPEGWLAVTSKHLEEYQHACEELRSKLGDLGHIEGAKIPETLLTLLAKDAFQSPWAVYFSEAIKNSHRVVDTPADVQFKLNVVDRDGRSLLELDPIYNHERFRLTHADNSDALSKGEQWVRRRDAWIRIDKDKCSRIKAAIDILGLEHSTTGFSFPASQREKVIEIFSLLGSIEHSQSYAAFLTQLADFEKIEEVDLPTNLKPEIAFRTYQKHGYYWLAFLHRFGLNGILADDMGLGKTLQTLAVIQRAKERDAGKLPSLIICPTSVVHNWEAEAQRFFKDCPVIRYTGTNRAKKLRLIKDFLKLKEYGLSSPLVVTSYDIARRDHEELNRIPWVYVVVDEGHNIKNPDAHRTKAIKTINGHHKLALTGTPIQNNLEELWSLFDFAMPGYLGARKVFREKYGRNGQVDWTAVRQGPDNLRHRIHPFIMRRLKENVAKDLPPKTIVDQKIELSPLQVDLYKKVLEGAEYQKLLQEVESKGVQRAQPYILAAYT